MMNNVVDPGLLTPETITKEDVKKLISADATEKEVTIFLQIAKLNKLNPFKREIYLIKYRGQPAHIVTGYETYLKRAERSNKYAGFRVWTEGRGGELKACIEVRRKDWEKPLYHEVEYSEYVQRKRDGSLTRFWKEKPKTMLKKVVISQAFRFAFPDELAGMPYTSEEMPTEETEKIKETLQPPKAKEPEESIAPETTVAPEEPEKPVEVPEEPQTIPEPPPKETTELSQINAKLRKLKGALGESDFNSILKTAGVNLKKGMSIAKAKEVIALLEQYVIGENEN